MSKNKQSLMITHPELCAEWDYEKNTEITPQEVSYGSNKKVWWKDRLGHSWKATINARANRGDGCPYCSNKVVLPGFNDLKTLFPEIAAEWDYEKNGELKPDQVISKGAKRVWWKCKSCNYEWEAPILSRSSGHGCPACAHQVVVPGKTDLATRFPLVAAEWDYERNSGVTPNEIMPGSNKKYWWKDRFGHEWQASPNDRCGSGTGCPYCGSKKLLTGFNDLATVYPDLATEWNYEKNGELLPSMVTSKNGRRVWWRCSVCGNEWEASVATRADGRSCPKCSKHLHTSFPEQAIYFYVKKAFPDAINGYRDIFPKTMELDIYIPSVSLGVEYDGAAWHKGAYSKDKETRKYAICKEHGITLLRVVELLHNEPLKPENCDAAIERRNVSFNSLDTAIRSILETCGIGSIEINTEKDYAAIKSTYVTTLKEKSLIVNRPDLAEEWNKEKNKELTSEMVSMYSAEKVWWKCRVCGGEWKTSVVNRTNGSGCPVCANKILVRGINDLYSKYPELATEWNEGKNNISCTEVLCGGTKKWWWICKECGYEWQASIATRKTGIGCPHCGQTKSHKTVIRNLIEKNGSFADKFPHIASEWNYEKNGSLKPEDFTSHSGQTVWWKCKNGHEWQAKISNRTAHAQGCPICFNAKRKKKK